MKREEKKLTEADNSRLVEVGSIVAAVHREEHSIAVVEEGLRSIVDFVGEVSRTFWLRLRKEKQKRKNSLIDFYIAILC